MTLNYRLTALLERRTIWIAAVAVVLSIQAVLVLKHEPWLDEWQALQISLQSPSLGALMENLRYEGHPPLWYLLLRLLGGAMPPGWVLAAAQLPIAIAIQCLILLRLPLARIERLLLACNPYILIDYGAISRSLGLGVLLLLLAILFRERRASWIAVAALPLTDFLFGVLSFGCIVLAYREKRLWWPGLALWFASGLAATWSVRPAPDMIPALWLSGWSHDALIELARFGALVIPIGLNGGHLQWNQLPPVMAALAGGLAFFWLGWFMLRRDPWALAAFGAFAVLLFGFSMFVYPLAIRHVSLAALLLVLLVALRQGARIESKLPFRIWLATGAACGVAIAAINIGEPFDTAAEAASYIRANHLELKHWVTFPDSRAQGVSALTGTEFERLERTCRESFIRWNYRSRVKDANSLDQELTRISIRSGGFYLLTDFDLLSAGTRFQSSARLLKHVPAGFDGQEYYLYEYRPDLPARTEILPQCAAIISPMPSAWRQRRFI